MKKNGEYVGVDEKFIPEDEKFVDESVLGDKEESKRKIKKVAKGIGIGYLVFLSIIIIMIVSIFIFAGSFIFKIGKTVDNVSRQVGGTSGLIDNIGSQAKNQMEKKNVDSFNFDYTYLQGEHRGADDRLDKIITNNKTNSEHIITVIYNGTSATTEDEIISIKKSLDKWTNYYYSVDYDSNGYINKVTIKDM